MESLQSFKQFQGDVKQSTSTAHVGQIVLPQLLPEHVQSPPWQSAEHPSTSHLHDTVDPKLRVANLEHINDRAHKFAPNDTRSTSISDAGKIVEHTPKPAGSDSQTPFVIRFKRNLPSEWASQSHTEKRRKSESSSAAQAQGDAKKTNERELPSEPATQSHSEKRFRPESLNAAQARGDANAISELTGWDSDLTELLSSGSENDDGNDTETVGSFPCMFSISRSLNNLSGTARAVRSKDTHSIPLVS